MDSTVPFYLDPKYILMVIVFLALIQYFIRNKRYSRESINDRMWRKIAFSHQELLPTLDSSEKELLKHTYQNTIFNSKTSLVKSGIKKKLSKNKKVSFSLDSNLTHTFPYYLKDTQFD